MAKLLEREERSSTVQDPEAGVRDEERLGPSGPHIRCPLCGWQPAAQDRWSCRCGHVWHTFDTGGICPGCIYQWTRTQCLACGQWSQHSDWYKQ